MEKIARIAVLAITVALAGAAGCERGAYIGEIRPNTPPTVKLTSGPLEGDTTVYRIEFSWVGNDRDGTVQYYEFAVCDGNPFGFDPADTTGFDKWTRTHRTDSLFRFRADDYEKNVVISGSKFGRYRKTHTFFIRAVDDRGGRSDPAYRSFTSRTLAPYAIIETPRNPFPGQTQFVPPTIRFSWRSEDPIDMPWNKQEADSVRLLLIPDDGRVLSDLNKTPKDFENRWGPWISRDAPGDSGRSTVIGDDELLDKLNSYVFAIQAMDEAGAVTTVFDPKLNVRVFAVMRGTGPLLKVSEPYLGTFSFIGIDNRPETFKMPGGFAFHFTWKADASTYGGEVSSYRYGWDVADVNNPDDWDVLPSPFITSIPATSFSSGVHTLFIEAVDNDGISTIAQMEVTVFPLLMNRNLLWVDDFYSTNFYQQTYAFPTESEHDEFWLNICSRATGFSPERDVYETVAYGFEPPDIELMWKYRNIIWSYSSEDRINAWDDMIYFIPESMIGRVSQLSINFLSIFVASGGHIWTEGKSDKRGGLSAVLWDVMSFPANLRCEITGLRSGCDGDTSGVFSMAYKDYCVSVIDKVAPIPRNDSRMPRRGEDRDALRYAYSDVHDPVTAAHPGLPPTLSLWERVTYPGKFFDPMTRGFLYVELYNPAYWMSLSGARTQSCFHPMYRMRARSATSAVEGATVAFWTTKYAGVVAHVPGAVAAPSVQFGLPLWFFNRAQTDSIADVIFREWRISAK
jgi:hypothetical protein